MPSASTAMTRQAVGAALDRAQTSDKPSMIACRTIIGYGAPTKEGTAATHGSPLGKEEVAGAREKLGWPYRSPSIVPEAILTAWRRFRRAGRCQARRVGAPARQRSPSATSSTAASRALLPEKFDAAFARMKRAIVAEAAKIATRQSSQKVLEVLAAGPAGAARRLGRSHRLQQHQRPRRWRWCEPPNYAGSYIHYGVREHGMAAAMNGIALHGGFIPYGGTFLVFTDYCRPSIRLSALMGQRVIYVMTHDSIGLGEDGPTHQPVEHLAALRAIPNLLVFRPADTVETAECWALGARRTATAPRSWR